MPERPPISPKTRMIQQEATPPASQPTRLTLPFVDSDPLTDVRWAILLLPLWWILGVEQFIWPVIFTVATIKVLAIQKFRLAAPRPLRWFALFIAAVLISGLFVEDAARMLTYVRNLGAFMGGFLALLIIINRARSWRSIDRLLNAILVIMFLAGFAGLLAVLGVWRPQLESLAGQLLPDSVAGTGYGQVIVTRAFGQRNWFVGLGEYYRLRSFFLFSNHYSSALVYVLPFFFMRAGQTRGLKKVLFSLIIAMLLVNLVYTTGRVATLSLMAGALYFAVFHSLSRRVIRVLLSAGLATAMLLLLLTTTIELSTSRIDEGLLNQTAEAVEAFTFARGPGSFTNRFGVYEATLQGFLERPLFGWGTERDVEGLEIPAGSHSEYLAALYRQGLLGLIALVGLLITTWRATRPLKGAAAAGPAGTFLRYGRWFFVASLINSIMTDPTVDSTTFVMLWVLLALLVATSRLLHHENEHALPGR